MKYFWRLLYNLIVIPLGILFYNIISIFNQKFKKGVIGRKSTFKKVQELKNQYPNNELILFHSASLGEYEQVKPVIKGIKNKNADLICVVSFASPSGYDNAARIPEVDMYIYLPFDYRGSIKKFLVLLNPKKIVFVTYELWPNLLHFSKKMGITTYLISARIRSSSRKWNFYIKSFFADLYNSIDYIFTVSENDKILLEKFIKRKKNNLMTLGDSRYDQVIQRSELRKDRNIPNLFDNGFVISTGSVWEPDLEVIISPLIQEYKNNKNLKLIIAPHETDDSHVNQIKSEFDKAGIKINKYSEIQDKCDSRVVIVDKIGVLAELYHQSNIAFVGGSFKSLIHNVMEPAVAGIPVVFGPKYHNSREAEQLVKHGGGFCVENSEEFANIVNTLINNKDKYQIASQASKDVIFRNKGAGQRIVEQILKS